MTPNTLGIYMFIRNGIYYDYPFKEAIESALPIADKIVLCECYSDKDNTLEELEKIQRQHPAQIEIVQQNWVSGPRPFERLSYLGNYASMFLDTDWTWQLQADEVIHEDSYPEIRKAIEIQDPKITAQRVHYTHLLANYETEFDFCYTSLIRIARKGTGWALIGDACQLDKQGYDREEVRDTGVRVYHYGKVHEGTVGFRKEWDFQQLFTDIGFPDPKMKEMEVQFGKPYCDYVYLFESSIKEGKVRKFLGTHPLVMSRRIAEFKEGGWEQFQSKMKEGLTLNE